MSEENIGKTVRFTLDPLNLPTLTREQQDRLDSMRNEDIDLTDIPSQAGKGGWTRPGLYGGRVGELRRQSEQEGVLILEEAVVEGFRRMGDTSAHKMNAVLLEYLESHRKSA